MLLTHHFSILQKSARLGQMVVGSLADLLSVREDGLRLLLCVLAGAFFFFPFFLFFPTNGTKGLHQGD